MIDLWQMLRDLLTVNELTNWNIKASIEAKSRPLKCHIPTLKSDTQEYQGLCEMLSNSTNRFVSSRREKRIDLFFVRNRNEQVFVVHQIYSVGQTHRCAAIPFELIQSETTVPWLEIQSLSLDSLSTFPDAESAGRGFGHRSNGHRIFGFGYLFLRFRLDLGEIADLQSNTSGSPVALRLSSDLGKFSEVLFLRNDADRSTDELSQRSLREEHRRDVVEIPREKRDFRLLRTMNTSFRISINNDNFLSSKCRRCRKIDWKRR